MSLKRQNSRKQQTLGRKYFTKIGKRPSLSETVRVASTCFYPNPGTSHILKYLSLTINLTNLALIASLSSSPPLPSSPSFSSLLAAGKDCLSARRQNIENNQTLGQIKKINRGISLYQTFTFASATFSPNLGASHILKNLGFHLTNLALIASLSSSPPLPSSPSLSSLLTAGKVCFSARAKLTGEMSDPEESDSSRSAAERRTI